MKPFGKLISFEDANQVISNRILPINTVETLDIGRALNRVLAEDIIARHHTPPFNRAGMDGYAVRSQDISRASLASPALLSLAGTIYAGPTHPGRLKPGDALRIATGARLPSGANAVVMVEDTASEGELVSIYKPAGRGANIGLKGEDIRKGEHILKAGRLLDAGKIGVLASQGIRRVKVYKKPRVAVMPTGEEIAALGKRLKPGQLYDINSHTLAAVVRESGGEPLLMPISGDSLEALRTNMEKALGAEMVVTSGGSSVGEKDLLINILEEQGEVLFHGINIKPGKPTTFAVVEGKAVMGMPGYPTSCLINAYLLLGPAIRRMARLPLKRQYIVRGVLADKVWGGNGRRRFQPVRMEGELVYAVAKESGAITGTAQADGYVVVDENLTCLEKGSPVDVTLF
jgi:molybdenum cofactor synthesis domain-containing protein